MTRRGSAADRPSERPIRVDMVADLACPWCYIGLVRLDRAREMRPHCAVKLRWHPFLLNPQLPPEGMERGAYLRAKFGGTAAARRVYARIEEAGRADGIDFAFERIARTPNTVDAQRLILFAAQRALDEAVIRRLFRALFEEGDDIGAPEPLIRLGGEAGLDTAELRDLFAGDDYVTEVLRAHRSAEAIGIRGVPVLIIEREHIITGAQPPEVLAGLLDLAASEQRE